MRAIILLFLFPLLAFSQADSTFEYSLLVGHVRSLEDSLPISNSTIRIIGMDSSIQEIGVDSNGYFETKLKVQTAYSLTVSAPGYLNAKGREYSPERKKLVHLYELAKLEECTGMVPLMVYDKNDFKKVYDAENPDFDVLDWFHGILSDNPNLIVEFIGYRDMDEAKSISRKRSDFAVQQLIEKGIEKERIKAVDGKTDSELTNRLKGSRLIEKTKVEHNRFLVFSIKGNDWNEE